MSIFVFFETDRLTGTSDVWYENREKKKKKTDRWVFAPYFGCYDHESLHRIVDRCICDCLRTIFHCNKWYLWKKTNIIWLILTNHLI